MTTRSTSHAGCEELIVIRWLICQDAEAIARWVEPVLGVNTQGHSAMLCTTLYPVPCDE